jgi:hypothetical protein
MNNVQRFENLMSFKTVDRLPMIEWAFYWDKTIDRWYSEGLDRNITDVAEIRKSLGLDSYQQFWFRPLSKKCPEPECHGAPLIKDRKDYLELKPLLYPKQAFDVKTMETWAAEQKAGETVVWITFEGFFWFPRALFGIENHMYAFYDNPDLMHEMNSDLLEYHLWILNELGKIVTPNFMTFAEDMSYNHGPMLSKDSFDQFLAPYYKKIVPELKKRNIKTFVDSDGDIAQIIPWLIEVGLEGVLPLERMASVDVSQIRKDHPEFLLIGAFDKTVMHLGSEAMRTEFERLLPVMKQGGFIASVDHQTPPDVSLETYVEYISLLKEYCTRSAE